MKIKTWKQDTLFVIPAILDFPNFWSYPTLKKVPKYILFRTVKSYKKTPSKLAQWKEVTGTIGGDSTIVVLSFVIRISCPSTGTFSWDDGVDDADEAELETVLHVVDVDMHLIENSQRHHTAEYDRAEEDARDLIVRRGQPFKVTITFDREFDQELDDLDLVFTIGGCLVLYRLNYTNVRKIVDI